jgi:phage-related minor tail protein
MSLLGTMVVRLAADMARYKSDLGEAANATTDAAQRIEGATGKAGAAVGRMNGSMGDAVRGAEALHGAAGLAGVGIGALAVGLAAAAYAAYKGAQENPAYLKALIMTGNAAGTTAGQMADMARSIGHSVGTQYEAAAALALMAGSGQVAGASLQKFSQVAVEMERTLGQSVGDTVKVFAELGQEPVKASIKLNESMNYLTASTFAQIKAAQELGDKAKAASIAQDAYATAMQTRTGQIKGNLGTLETAWASLGKAAKWAWDGMLNLGREDTLTQKLAAVSAEIEKGRKAFDPSAFGGNAEARAKLQTNLQLQANLQEMVRLETHGAESAGERAASEKARITWMQEGDKYLTKQEKMEKAIARLRFEGNAAGATALEIEKRIAVEREKYADKPNKTKTDNSAARELEKEAALLATLSGVNADYQQKLSLLQVMRAKGNVTEVEYIALVEQLIAKQPMASKLMADAAKQIQAVEKANLAADQAHGKYVQGLANGLDKLQAEVVAQNEVNDRLGLSKEAIAALDSAKMNLMATELELQAVRSYDKNLDEAEYNLTMQQAKAYRELANAKSFGAAKAATIDAAKEADAEWEKTSDSINQILTDARMRGFESAKDVAGNMRDTIVNMFKTLVLRPIISPVMKPVSQAIGGSLGMTGAASAQGAGGNLLGTAGNLSRLYDSITGGFTKVSARATSDFNTLATSSIGQSMGMSGAATVGNNAYVAPQMTSGSLAASSAIGTAAGYAAGAAAGLAIGNAIAGEFGSSNTVTAGVIIGSIVGGPIGGAIGGAIGGLVNRAFGMGNTELTSQGTRGTFNSAGFAGQNYANYHQEGRWFRSDKNWTDTSAVDPKTLKSWSSSFAGMQNAVAGTAASVGLATEKVYAYSKAIDIAAGSTAEQVTALFTGMADDMARTAAPAIATFSKEGETASTTLQRLSTSITTANAWLSMLRNRLFDVSMAGADAASKLADAFGGLDNLAASSKAYYETYYNEAERTVRSSEDLAKAMALVNVALPVSKDAFRSVVSSLDLTTESGRNAYAVLLALAPEFATTTDAIARMAKEQADALKASNEAIVKDYASARKAAEDAAKAAEDAAKAMATTLSAAMDEAQQAYNDANRAAVDAAKAIKDALAQAGSGIASLIAELTATQGASDPLTLMRNRQTAYLTDMSAARGGDVEASGRVASSAKAYLDANAIVSSLASQSAVTAQVVAELKALPAVQTYEQQMLAAAQATTAAVTALNGKLVTELTVTARSDILKLVQFVANTDLLPPDLKQLALDTVGTLDKTINFVNGSQLPPDAQVLALRASDIIVRTIGLAASNGMNAQQMALVMMTDSAVAKTIGLAAGANDQAALAVAAMQSETIRKTIEASGGALTDDQAKLIDGIWAYNKSIIFSAVIDQASLDAANLALATVGSASSAIPTATVPIATSSGTTLMSEAAYNTAFNAWAQLASTTSNQIWESVKASIPTLTKYVTQFDDDTGDAYQALVYDTAATSAARLPAFDAQYAVWKAANPPPSHKNGLASVPYDNYNANLHAGEAVLDAPFAAGLRKYGVPSSNNDALVAEIKALREEVRQLRADNSRENNAIAAHSADTADTNRQMYRNGTLVYTDPSAPIDTKVAA